MFVLYVFKVEKLEMAASSCNKASLTKESVSSLYIINPFRASAVAAWFSTHPPTSARISALKKYRHQ